MPNVYRSILRLAAIASFCGATAANVLPGTTLVLQDGRSLEGSVTQVAEIAAKPGSIDPGTREIVVVDDDLRRTWFPQRLLQQVVPGGSSEGYEKITIEHNRASRGRMVTSIGQVADVQPFDKFGRRSISLAGPHGRFDIIQGITEITPLWTRVEAIGTVGAVLHEWDMRLATSSFSTEQLDQILKHPARNTGDNVERRLQIARLYLQSERYRDARREIESIAREFPPRAESLETIAKDVQQMEARQVLQELQLRRRAGQHERTLDMLENFPSQDVAGEILIEVREAIGQYRQISQSIAEFHRLFETHTAKLEDPALRRQLEILQEDMRQHLGPHVLDRVAPYLRLAAGSTQSAESLLAIAASGWVLGANKAIEDLDVALSVTRVRELIRQYLRATDEEARRLALASMQSEIGATPDNVATILAHMRPPQEDLTEATEVAPRCFRFQVPGSTAADPPVAYEVQLPLEYNPYVRYPAVVTLPPVPNETARQMDWWCGEATDDDGRIGEAVRQGFIVIAVDWATHGQRRYHYSASEHGAVLTSLRDACRHFSIDTDRVFLSGHSAGGVAALDIALAHPDLWAGVVPITAVSDQYCAHYTPNAVGLPLYFVVGELDGDAMLRNARDFNRYLTRTGYDVTVVEYLGRGHDHFHEEIKRVFDWMQRRRRNFFPERFEVATMRPWDNFFWWVELDGLPARSIVYPEEWPRDGARAMTVSGRINATNGVLVNAGAEKITVWLSPEIVDFDKRVTIQVNRRRINLAELEAELEPILEDARTRVDRLHPFWIMYEVTGR